MIVRMMLSMLIGLLMCAGCASYATPGRGVDMAAAGVLHDPKRADTDGEIQLAFDKKPLATFPAGVAVVRIQAAGYSSPTAQGWGYGRYSVVLTRDVEKPEHLERFAKLPGVRGVAPLNRLLLSGDFRSDRQLREGAARLQADVLLVYTLDTTFTSEDKAKPLSVVSLGLSPNQQVRLTTTASAVLLDTRDGYVYGVAEATEQRQQFTNAWQNEVAVDETRRATEAAAFEKLVGELETTWKGVVATYGKNGGV